MTEERENIKFHKIAQYRNAVRVMRDTLAFKGMEEKGNPIYDYSSLPAIEVRGTVKLHGINASIISHPNGDITFHSKEKLLATYKRDGTTEVYGDNAGFASYMLGNIGNVKALLENFRDYYSIMSESVVKICGEWCGEGIKKGVGISNIEKSFFVFGAKVEDVWITDDTITHPSDSNWRVYDIHYFPTFSVLIDLNMPEKASIDFERLTMQVEERCPVASRLCPEEDCLIGEGVVWVPVGYGLESNTGTWFKTKGQKHSSSKVKSVASVDPEKIKSVENFIEYAVTDNRLDQGINVIGLDQSLIGKFIGWVNRDILQEEADVLLTNNLEMKDVGKHISNKARAFYMSKL